MATKDELVAFGQAHGVAVDMSMLKGDIEAAIAGAGYDPTTLEEPGVSETPPNGNGNANGEEAEDRVSHDAKWSSYAEKPADKDADERPAPGPQVEQTLGTAKED